MRSQVRAALDLLSQGFVRAFCFVFGLEFPLKWAALVTEHLSGSSVTVSDDLHYRFLTLNPLLLWRARTLLSKEPETVAWLKGLPKDSVLYDVGANVGVFSIYAGVRGLKVFSFEPESSNFGVLNKNIQINRLHGRVTAYCLAISDSSGYDTLRMTSMTTGSAHHSFGRNVDAFARDFTPVFEQGCVGVTLDSLVYDNGFPCPGYLKIDVDGLESRIIAGAGRLLADPKLRGVLIELNEGLPEDIAIKETMLKNGFSVSHTGESVEHVSTGMKVRNYIFERKL